MRLMSNVAAVEAEWSGTHVRKPEAIAIRSKYSGTQLFKVPAL
jgi:hypothetical protein